MRVSTSYSRLHDVACLMLLLHLFYSVLDAAESRMSDNE